MSQTELIKNHLENGKPITPIDALNYYGCFRLSARILELRKSGMNIITQNIKRGEKTFASYSLAV